MRTLRVVVTLVVVLGAPACSGKSNPLVPSGLNLRQDWTVSGTGNNVVDMPTYVTRVRVIGSFTGNSSNFIIWVGQSLLVNELLGTAWNTTRYEGVHATTGGVVRIEHSNLVVWSLTEVR